MVWYGVGMVFGMACYGLLCCVEACEQVRTMPASRNPLEGNLHRAAEPFAGYCTVPYMQPLLQSV